jgi:hypothetical protein
MSDLPDHPVALPYRYVFEPDELDGIAACNEAHGFAAVKGVLPADRVEELKASIQQVLNPDQDLQPGQGRLIHAFIERSPALERLLAHPPFMRLYAHLFGTEEMTLHRSAAILKHGGYRGVPWHTDFSWVDPPRTYNDILNKGDWPNGMWFYLNGTHPRRAGLAVIADSHRPDWAGPEGFAFTEARSSFYPEGTEPKAYEGMDVPGMVPLFTEPGDLIVFAARTYHAAYPHTGDEMRMSCALICRPGRTPYPVPWPLPESARRFAASLPETLRPYVEYYPGIDLSWKSAG